MYGASMLVSLEGHQGTSHYLSLALWLFHRHKYQPPSLKGFTLPREPPLYVVEIFAASVRYCIIQIKYFAEGARIFAIHLKNVREKSLGK